MERRGTTDVNWEQSISSMYTVGAEEVSKAPLRLLVLVRAASPRKALLLAGGGGRGTVMIAFGFRGSQAVL